MNLPTIYKRTSKGQLQQWNIVVDGPVYYTQEGVVGGKISTTKPTTCFPKNIGKSNETTAEQQAVLEATAKRDKKLKTGYCENISNVDGVSFQKPMKGYKLKDRLSEVRFPVLCSDKLNGIRCQSNKQRSFSTGGETFHTIPHIRNALKPFFEQYPDAFIDGEAWNYDLRQNLNRLTSIVSVVHKEDDLTPELLEESRKIVGLYLFDGYGFENVTEDTPFVHRFENLSEIIKELAPQYVQMVEHFPVASYSELLELMKENKKRGGEGLMIRWGDCPFKHGRSKFLLKMKHFEDDEFEIVDVEEGSGDWSGCAKRMILRLNEPDSTGETTFASNIQGDRAYLAKMLSDRDKIIGKMATCEYQHLSEYGVPQLPWVKAIRDYE